MKFKNAHPLTPDQIAAIEAENEWRLPQAFRAFLMHHNGGVPDATICGFGDDEDCGVTSFIPADQIKQEARFIENLADNTIPIAWAECGNYVLLDMREPGAVRFWDHEEPERDIVLSATFSGFLDALRVFSPEEIGDVKVVRVWIDPEFAKSLK